MRIKFYILTIGLSAFTFAGCTTTSNTNANLRNVNSNTAVVVNSNTNTVTTTNTNTNRWTNSNVSREDYNKSRSEYEKDKGDSTIGQGVNDSWLWFKTRTALLTTNDLRESTINVDVVNDVVTLRGTVGSNAEKTKAEQVAKGIDGVKSVTNNLKVSATDSVTNQMVNGNTAGNTKSNSNTNK